MTSTPTDPTAPADDGPWLTIGEAARHLHVSINTLRRWEAAGLVVPHRLPSGHRRYSRTQLEELLERVA